MSLYKLLGVGKTASKQEIKVAYRKLALQFHPDKHAQSPPQAKAAAGAKFRQISSAYETLADDRKRAAYDRSPDNNVREARRQPKPRDSSSNSTQSHPRYSSASNGSGSSGGGGLRRAIRNLTMGKVLKMGLHFILWLLKHIILFILRVIIAVLEQAIEDWERKREKERRKWRW